MKKKVGIGIQDFSRIREDNCFYVDKTYFIKEWWENEDKATIITRPRRFGKTLNMSMLEHFFSLQYAGRSDLFEGLSIWKEERYRKLQGTYPVINLSFANVKEITFKGASYRIRQILAHEYIKYYFLVNEDILSVDEKKYYKWMAGEMKEEDVSKALYHLSRYLYRYYGKKVIILLDEYDTPMLEAQSNGYLKELKMLIRNFYDFTFRKNPWVERGIMIGITKMDCKWMFVQSEHLQVVDIMSDKYETSFGFTEEEVFVALDRYDMGEEKEKVKHWYDGFIFGNCCSIYNPWCIANFLDERRYKLYWAETSTNSLVGRIFCEGSREIKISFSKLLQGEHIWRRINEYLLGDSIDNKEETIWGFLIASGYMKIVAKKDFNIYSKQETLCELSFVNLEVKRMFGYMVRKWFGYTGGDYEYFVRAMFADNVEDMNAYLERAILRIFNFFSTEREVRREESETFYYSLVLALMADLGKQYNFISYYECGFGRYDVVLEPKNNGEKAFILEFKIYEQETEEGLEDTVQAALMQIEGKQYEASLIEKGILAKDIRKYGFAFEGKRVLIR